MLNMKDFGEHVKIKPAIAAFIVTLLFWVLPHPADVDVQGWRLLGIFVGTIVAIIGKALPIGGAALFGIMLVGLSQVTNPGNPKGAINDALSGFSNSLIWLIGIAFFISRGFIKTGLGSRVAYYFVSVLGKKTLGISYGLTFAEVLLAPVMPSNTARGGGVLFPINRSISESLDSHGDEKTRKKVGAFLTLVGYQINVITCAMFVTATAPNPLIVSGMSSVAGFEFSWLDWAIAACVPGLASAIIIPYVLFKIYAPEIKETPNAREFAKEKLQELGKMTAPEWVMVFVFILLLMIWAGVPKLLFSSPYLNINSTTGALIGLCTLLFTGVLTWDDLLREKGAWDTITWFSSLVMMAKFINKLGVVGWFSTQIQNGLTSMGLTWPIALVLLVLIYFFIHYFFASTTAHISALYASFLGVAIAMGAPAPLACMSIGFASPLCASLTHYGTGTAPVLFGSGYVTMNEWWKFGLITAIINLLIWSTVGLLWWNILGYTA